MKDPRIGNLSREDAAILKKQIEEMGLLDSMPVWMAREIAEKTAPPEESKKSENEKT